MANQPVVPSWMGKVAVTALITALIGGALAWAQGTSKMDARQDGDIRVLSEAKLNVQKDVEEIKLTQRRMEDKLDRALEQR